jgi:hypothetical protein
MNFNKIKFDETYDLNVINELYQIGALNIYYDILTRNEPVIENFLLQLSINKLKNDHDSINREIDLDLDWQELPHAKASRVEYMKKEANIFDESSWVELFKWHAEIAQRFYSVFEPRVINL